MAQTLLDLHTGYRCMTPLMPVSALMGLAHLKAAYGHATASH